MHHCHPHPVCHQDDDGDGDGDDHDDHIHHPHHEIRAGVQPYLRDVSGRIRTHGMRSKLCEGKIGIPSNNDHDEDTVMLMITKKMEAVNFQMYALFPVL